MILEAGLIGVYFFFCGALISYLLGKVFPSVEGMTDTGLLSDIVLEVFCLSAASYVFLQISNEVVVLRRLSEHFSGGGLMYSFAIFLFMGDLQRKIKTLFQIV